MGVSEIETLADASTTAEVSESVAAKIGRWFVRIVEQDFTAPLSFILLAIAYVGSRVYWLNLGYGTDPDAWRVAMVAEHLWAEGEYLPSRLPGYPLHELVTAGLVKQGWIWTNLSTVIISLAGVYVFAALAKKLELPNRGALTLGFAFAPLLWINSVMTMDYMWALTFLLATYLALLHRAPTLGGISLGIAAGFRLTSLFMLPVFLLLLWRMPNRDQGRTFAFTAIATTALAFLPVLATYGLHFLNFYDQDVQIDEFIKRLGKDGLGIIGGVAVLFVLLLSIKRLIRFPLDLWRDAHVLMWVAAIGVLFASYTRLPHEIAYLIPVFPFGYFLMARYLSRTLLVAVLGVIIVAGFIDVTSPDDTAGIDASTFTSARLGRGMLLSDIDTLRNQKDFAEELRELTTTHRGIRTPATIVVGFIYPELVTLFQDDLDIEVLEKDRSAISQLSDKGHACEPICGTRPTLEYVWLLDFDTFQRYKSNGRFIYYTADAARSTFAVYGYRPGYFGAFELQLSRDNPSLGAGTAATDR